MKHKLQHANWLHAAGKRRAESSLNFDSTRVELDKRNHKKIYSDAERVALFDPSNAHNNQQVTS